MHSSRKVPFDASSSATCSVIASEASAASRKPARSRSERSSLDSSAWISHRIDSIVFREVMSSSSASRMRDLAEDARPTAMDATSRADGVGGSSPPPLAPNAPPPERSASSARVAATAVISNSATFFCSVPISFSARFDAAISPVSAERRSPSRASRRPMFPAALAATATSGCLDRVFVSSRCPARCDLAAGLSMVSMSSSPSSSANGARMSSASSTAAESEAWSELLAASSVSMRHTAIAFDSALASSRSSSARSTRSRMAASSISSALILDSARTVRDSASSAAFLAFANFSNFFSDALARVSAARAASAASFFSRSDAASRSRSRSRVATASLSCRCISVRCCVAAARSSDTRLSISVASRSLSLNSRLSPRNVLTTSTSRGRVPMSPPSMLLPAESTIPSSSSDGSSSSPVDMAAASSASAASSSSTSSRPFDAAARLPPRRRDLLAPATPNLPNPSMASNPS